MKSLIQEKYILLLMLFLTIPSLRAIYKYVPYPEIASAIYIISCALFFLFILKFSLSVRWIKKTLDEKYLTLCLILLYGACSYVIYPIADARKNTGQGSTGDDAIIEPALTLLTDAKLYSSTLYDGAPVSPGPGWILQNSPFALFDIFWLLSVSYIALSAVVCRFIFHNYRETNTVLLLLSSSLIFWELLVTGHDLISIGFCFVIFVLFTYKQSINKSASFHVLIPLAIAVGIFATSRVFFICFPVLLSAFLWKFNMKKAVVFLVVSLAVAISLHGYFYLTSDYYQPLHLFDRGSKSVGVYLSLTGLVTTLIAFFIVYKKLENNIENWLLSVFVCLSIPLLFISAGEFISSDFNLLIWEGGNYLIPPVPLLLFLVACKFLREPANPEFA